MLFVKPVKPKAVVMLSGGLDSATAAAAAADAGYSLHSLRFDYGQRHRVELECALLQLRDQGFESDQVVEIPLGHLKSALTGCEAVPKGRAEGEMSSLIPVTYVPARNLVFLSLAVGYADSIGADCVYAGFNQLDYSGYPDCRVEFVRAFQQAVNVGTKRGAETGQGVRIVTPLINLTKAEIISLGSSLGVDYRNTHSCYDPFEDGACGQCDSCILRQKGFVEAGIADPTRYTAKFSG